MDLFLGNPGTCGSGACIFIPNQTESIMLKRPVTNRGSNLLGELVAVLTALELLRLNTGKVSKGAKISYMCFVVTSWKRADLLALVCGVYCEFVTFPLVSWVRCVT